MKIRGLQFENEKITSYMFKLNNKNILFDFGSDDLTKEEISQIDMIFISHYHYDHCNGLFKYWEYLPKSCRIIFTITTEKMLFDIADRYFDTDYKINKFGKFLDSVGYITHFEEKEELNGIKFTSYKSGHIFGGAMYLIKDDNTSLFFSGDMEYVSSDFDRMYLVSDKIHADFAILDGTNISEADFKFSKLNSIKFNKKNPMTLSCKSEKAIFVARVLAKKYPDALILYDAGHYQSVESFYLNGYDCFYSDNKNILTKTLYNQTNHYDNLKGKPVITLTNENDKVFSPDRLFSLHIGDSDRKDFIENYLNPDCTIILGHHNNPNIEEFCNKNNYYYIKKGEYDYGKK